MDGDPAPQAVLNLLACKCARSCQLPKCVCLVNGLRCTDMCKLRDCTNQQPEVDVEITNVIYDPDDDDENKPDEY